MFIVSHRPHYCQDKNKSQVKYKGNLIVVYSFLRHSELTFLMVSRLNMICYLLVFSPRRLKFVKRLRRITDMIKAFTLCKIS